MKKRMLALLVLALLALALPALAEVRVTFNLDGGRGYFPDIVRQADSSGVIRFALPDTKPVRDGYTFLGWNCGGLELEYPMDPPGKSIAFLMSSGTLTYTAQWQSNNHPASGPYLIANMSDLVNANTTMDILQADFRCVQPETSTYFALHCWYGDDLPGAGYAGFQILKDGSHVLILSLWDAAGKSPSIEYAPYRQGGDSFDGEGSGKHILSSYDWEVNRWYTMRIQAVTTRGKTVYEQWIRPEGGAWEKVAAISFPQANIGFSWDCAFVEDFWPYTNGRASCQIRNAAGRVRSSGKWILNKSYWVINYDDQNFRQANVNYDCKALVYGGGIHLQIGGAGYEQCTRMPLTLQVSQCSVTDRGLLK